MFLTIPGFDHHACWWTRNLGFLGTAASGGFSPAKTAPPPPKCWTCQLGRKFTMLGRCFTQNVTNMFRGRIFRGNFGQSQKVGRPNGPSVVSAEKTSVASRAKTSVAAAEKTPDISMKSTTPGGTQLPLAVLVQQYGHRSKVRALGPWVLGLQRRGPGAHGPLGPRLVEEGR